MCLVRHWVPDSCIGVGSCSRYPRAGAGGPISVRMWQARSGGEYVEKKAGGWSADRKADGKADRQRIVGE